MYLELQEAAEAEQQWQQQQHCSTNGIVGCTVRQA
jgi:hypothetical protein